MRLAVLVLAFAVGAPACAAAQSVSDRPAIVVVGRGSAERAPDAFTVTGSLQGRGATQVAALEGLAAVQEGVLDRLPRLEGLTDAKVTTGAISVSPVYNPSCGSDRYESEEGCPITGYRATVSVSMEAAPVERAGDAASLLAELGAQRTEIDSFDLRDPSALRDDANRAAFADARRQAELLAATSGQRIVRVLRVQDSDARTNPGVYAVDEVVVTGSRIRPQVLLNVAPEPVRRDASVTVIFEIE